jgi:hypothetical protein
MANRFPTAEPETGTHAWQATHGCFDDTVIRDRGFSIQDRPKRGPDIWQRRGRRFTAAEALRIAEAELRQQPLGW